MFDATTPIRPRTVLAVVLAAALAAAACAAPASAAEFGVITQTADADGTITRTATVSSAGLDLTTARGAAVLHGRVEAAAERVCRLDSGDQYVEAANDNFDSCVAHAAQGAQGWVSAQIARAGTDVLATARTPATVLRLAAADPSSR